MLPLGLDERRIVEKALPDVEVLALDDALGAGDLVSHDRAIEDAIVTVRKKPLGDELPDPVLGDEIVFETDEKARRARIASPVS